MMTTSLDVDGYSVNVILMDMEYGIYEEVIHNHDDSYSVFLNSRYNDVTLKQSFRHAINHIKKDDWSKESVQIIETEAHGEIPVVVSESELHKFDAILKRLRKKRDRIQRELRKYDKKYSDMCGHAIEEHNDKMLEQYEENKTFLG